jgi:hypothetical protein
MAARAHANIAAHCNTLLDAWPYLIKQLRTLNQCHCNYSRQLHACEAIARTQRPATPCLAPARLIVCCSSVEWSSSRQDQLLKHVQAAKQNTLQDRQHTH